VRNEGSGHVYNSSKYFVEKFGGSSPTPHQEKGKKVWKISNEGSIYIDFPVLFLLKTVTS
jgi:hypothetical protein